MVGMLLWKTPERGKRERAVTVRDISILHTRFLCVEILRGPRTPEAVLRRRCVSAGKKLRKLGVVRLVLPMEFSCGEQLEKLGFRPVSTLSLRRMLAADWVRWSLSERRIPLAGARVAVFADHLTGEIVRTVTELSLRHRYVQLDLPNGGEELCRQLRREYGVSLLLNMSQEQPADAQVLFDPRTDCCGVGVIPLHDETAPLPPIGLPPVLEDALPAGVNRGQLLSALREAGVLQPGQIAVGGADFGK